MLHIVEQITAVIDALVVVILVLGTAWSFGRALMAMIERRSNGDLLIRQLRVNLGQVLLLSLEVLIVSDILHSIVKRSIQEVGILVVVVVIRIALSFFLEREISHLQEAEKRGSAGDETGSTDAA